MCGTSDTSAWSEFITIETLCGFFIAPWSEDFEGNDWVAPLRLVFQSYTRRPLAIVSLDSGSLGALLESRKTWSQYRVQMRGQIPTIPRPAKRKIYLAVPTTAMGLHAPDPIFPLPAPWITLESIDQS